MQNRPEKLWLCQFRGWIKVCSR